MAKWAVVIKIMIKVKLIPIRK